MLTIIYFIFMTDALVLSILVTVDYNLYKTHGDNIINHVLSYWNNVNKIMEELDNPKIKIILRGIAVPAVRYFVYNLVHLKTFIVDTDDR